MKKYNDKFEELLYATCKENFDEIQDIKDIDIPNFDNQFDKFKSKIDKESENKKNKCIYLKVAGLVAAMFICIYVIPTLYQVPCVNAIKKNFDNSMVRISGEIRSIIIDDKNNESRNTLDSHKKDIFNVENSEETSITNLYESIDSAQKDINYKIVKPFYMLEGYIIDRVEVIDVENISTVNQVYIKDGKHNIAINQSPIEDNSTTVISSNLDSKYEETYINDTKVIFLIEEESSYAIWNKDGFRFTIIATRGLSKKEIVKIINELK
ncbi:hypothetical protein SH2C18_25090 [Clostridium sediminicola]|uniref:hypothetical protein n=1 Tax=Clostridium sediminicola TaxID=3114879 RepID=UPI0031F1FA05